MRYIVTTPWMESGVTQFTTCARTLYVHKINGVQQGGSTVCVALSCISFFFGERHCAGQKEADLCRNNDKHSKTDFELSVSTEEDGVLAISL